MKISRFYKSRFITFFWSSDWGREEGSTGEKRVLHLKSHLLWRVAMQISFIMAGCYANLIYYGELLRAIPLFAWSGGVRK